MQLKFRRSKELKGMISKKYSYKTEIRFLISPEEREAFELLNMWDMKLAQFTQMPARDEPMSKDKEYFLGVYQHWTFKKLLEGIDYQDESSALILDVEEMIKDACESAQLYARRISSFNGSERIFDITDGEAKLAVVA